MIEHNNNQISGNDNNGRSIFGGLESSIEQDNPTYNGLQSQMQNIRDKLSKTSYRGIQVIKLTSQPQTYKGF